MSRRKSLEGGKGFVFYRCQICNADREWLTVDRLWYCDRSFLAMVQILRGPICDR